MAWEKFERKGHRTNFNHREFVVAFMKAFREGLSYRELAERSGDNQVYGRAHYLRRMGVNLPRLVRKNPGSSIDVDGLNKIVEEV